MFEKLRNRKIHKDLASCLSKANELYSNKGNTVLCHYCRQLMLKSEAAVVYNIEVDTIEYSHEACWSDNNEVSDVMPNPK